VNASASIPARLPKVGQISPYAPWPMVALGEIAEVKLGKMLDKARHLSGRRLPYLRNVNVRWGAVNTDDLREMNFDDDELDRFGLKAGDVLVCEGGEPGRAAVWNGHLPDLKFQKAIHRVRFRTPFEPGLLVYLLALLAQTGSLERRFTGSTRPDVVIDLRRESVVQRLILDTKWKIPRGDQPSDEDLRQMYTYNLHFGARHSLLVYPRADAAQRETVDAYSRSASLPLGHRHTCGTHFIDLFDAQEKLRTDIGARLLTQIVGHLRAA
jgi:hypothetical protein